MAARASQEPPAAARSSKGQPGAARGCQEQPGPARSRQGLPGAARGSQEPPRNTKTARNTVNLIFRGVSMLQKLPQIKSQARPGASKYSRVTPGHTPGQAPGTKKQQNK